MFPPSLSGLTRAAVALACAVATDPWLHGQAAAAAQRAPVARSNAVDGGVRSAAERTAVALVDPDPRVRVEAVLALGEGSPAMELALLQQALSDGDSDVRVAALDVLRDMRGPEVVTVVAAALVDADSDVRERAVYAIGHLGGHEARQALAMALGDREAGVRNAAAQLLSEPAALSSPSRGPLRRPPTTPRRGG